MHIYAYLMYMCAYLYIFQASIKGAAFGSPHKGGRAAFGGPPPFVVSFMEAWNINKYAYVYIKYA